MSKQYTSYVKGIACLLIVTHHCFIYHNGVNQYLGISIVGVFFFLSAYGLSILDSKKDILNTKSFITKRIFKVYFPLFLVNVIVIALFGFSVPMFNTLGEPPVLISPPPYKYIYYIFGISRLDTITWFVTVLVIFYIIYAIIRVIKNKALGVVILCIATIFMIIISFYERYGWWFYTGMIGFPMGCISAYLPKAKIVSRNIWALIFTFFLLVTCLLSVDYVNRLLVKTILLFGIVAFSCLLVFCIGNHLKRDYNIPVLSFLGSVSYEVYLCHNKILCCLYGVPAINECYRYILLIILSVFVAFLLHKINKFIQNKILYGII